jgi:hypothetical protein
MPQSTTLPHEYLIEMLVLSVTGSVHLDSCLASSENDRETRDLCSLASRRLTTLMESLKQEKESEANVGWRFPYLIINSTEIQVAVSRVVTRDFLPLLSGLEEKTFLF